ncbi:tRNA pseudouridine(13) synthase TruD [Microbulbifer sp. YPW16]|uniref:tRNA pseudouridine(13) synthase TruD n=1 Tax=Microbulbifer sp. YPW16 TaxID=2904242 RepID=UPI001E302AEA|nr:tRNA pseudouridine(13) synthase TruD [Microbulbifer sp. YPW16]UHQ56157.1 tRNA pseudouridine(13) synthase TruD [Microbulbifer sp. YPW16]
MTEQWDLDWPRALGGPVTHAEFRREPADFVVEELAAPTLAESGEHVYLQVRKRGANTGWVAQQLARVAGVAPRDVSYFGLKDRHAVTTQWFSVWLAQKPEPDWSGVVNEEIELLQHGRGARKLRRGEHAGNRFRIRLRDVRGDRDAADRLIGRLAAGVPNYFGEQRFGREGGNLSLARRLAEEGGRSRKSERAFAMSAARSWLFNQVVARRVREDSWRQLMDGEPESIPTGPLWGRGRNPAGADLAELEAAAIEPWQSWCNWLEHCGLKQERRPLVLVPEGLQHEWLGDDLELTFALPVGAFATAVLRELAELANVADAAIK